MAETVKQPPLEEQAKPDAAEKPATARGTIRNSFTEALVYITGYYGHTRSADSLQAGMPVSKHGMTPQLFCDAADRAGFRAKIIKRSLAEIPEQVFPIVVVLKSKEAVILTSKDETGQCSVVDPLTLREKIVFVQELEKAYAGYSIYIKPDNAEAVGGKMPIDHHWFWSCVIDNRGIYSKIVLASLFINIFALTSSIYVMNFYNRVLPNNAIETGWVLSIAAASIYVFDFMMRTLRGYFIDIAGRRADVIVAQRLYNQVLDMRLGTRQESTGAFANNMREFDSLREFFNSATMTGLVDFPFSIIFVVVIWLIAGAKMAVLLLFLYVLVLSVGFFMQLPVRRRVQEAMKTAEQKHGLLVETISSIETIRGVGGEGALRANYGTYAGKSAEAGQHSRFFSGLSVNFSTFIQMLSGILVVVLGMYLVQDKEMTMGALIACVILSSRAIAPIGQVAGLVNRYHQARSAYNNLDAVMNMPVERPRDKTFLHRPVLKGNFHLKDVGFSYPHAERPVLKDINLRIRAGEKLAIVGRIGSGKSTLIKLLVNFYEATSGTILVDDTDMRQVDPADLRRNIAYMGQDTGLLTGTIRENIVMGHPRATDEEVLRVAQIACVHDFVRTHPMGYDAPVGERGEGLSGGQRQAVSLARTLLMDSPILIMDEPTNSMDTGTEMSVLKNLHDYTKDKTMIIVTHKPALLKLVQRIIVMDNSLIVMDGPVEKVMKALGGGHVKVDK